MSAGIGRRLNAWYAQRVLQRRLVGYPNLISSSLHSHILRIFRNLKMKDSDLIDELIQLPFKIAKIALNLRIHNLDFRTFFNDIQMNAKVS
jgi:hypothetical protein